MNPEEKARIEIDNGELSPKKGITMVTAKTL